MRLLKSKKGKITTSVLNTAILTIILLVVLFQVYASLVPTAQAAGDSMNASNNCVAQGCYWNSTGVSGAECQVADSDLTGCAVTTTIPLNTLFAGTGFIFVIIMAALIVLVVKSFLQKGK